MQYSFGRITCTLLLTIFMVIVSFLLRAEAVPTATTGGLLQFDDRSEFLGSFIELESVTFDQSSVAPGMFTFCTSPLDTNTNQPPDCFIPGDIPPGISLDSLPDNVMPVNGVGFSTLTASTITLASDPPASQMELTFPDGVNAVAVDLLAFSNGVTYQVMVYGAGGTLLDTITTAGVSTGGTFFGLYSDEPITRVVLDNSDNEIIDNIFFGVVQNVEYYDDPDLFDGEFPDLTMEDFEESPIADSAFLFIPEPLDNRTNIAGGFAAGDIAEGLSIGTVTKTGGDTLAIVGANWFGNQTVVISPRLVNAELEVAFTEPNVYQVGMDLAVNGLMASDVQVIVYDYMGNIMGSTRVNVGTSETFFGVSSLKTIGKVVVLHPTRFEIVDNIRFGGTPNGLTIYYDEPGFMEKINRSSMEDFSESLANPPVNVVMCDEPLDKTSDNSCFAEGDIVHGLSISTRDSNVCPNCIYAYREDIICGTFPKTIGAFSGGDVLQLQFSEPTYYAGLSIYSSANFAFVYAKDGRLLGSIYIPPYQCAGGFLGVHSLEPISKIVLGEIVNQFYLDSVVFGSSFPWSLVMPSIMIKQE